MTNEPVGVAETAINIKEIYTTLSPLLVAVIVLLANSYFDRKQVRKQNMGRSYELLLSHIDHAAELLLKNPAATPEDYSDLSAKTSIVNIWASEEVYALTENLIDSIFDAHNYLVDYFNGDITRDVEIANQEYKALREVYANRYNQLVQQMRNELSSGKGAPMTFSTREFKQLREDNLFAKISKKG